MKKVLLLCFAICVLFVAKAQRVHFIYLQTENKVPFFLRMGDKIYSSSAEGYLILSRLADSTYVFTIGKPGKQASEERFSVAINNNDRGFLLKEMDSRLNLFDLQSMALIQPQMSAGNDVTMVKKTDDFSKLLSKAADDSTLLNVLVAKQKEKSKVTTAIADEPVQKTEPEVSTAKTNNPVVLDTTAQQETIPAAPKTDTVAVVQPTEVPAVATNDLQKDTVNKVTDTTGRREEVQVTTAPAEEVQEEYVRSVVTRKSESSTSEGFGLVFLDTYNGVTDTIRLLIPNPSVKVEIVESVKEEPVPAENKVVEMAEPPADTVAVSKSVEPEMERINDTVTAKPVATVRKTSCSSVATENDFSKLQKAMASKPNEIEMVLEARKGFRSKCYTTEQIRSLSTLFLTGQGKYIFFEAAYPRVSDPEQFPALQSELKSDYHYNNRFKTLVDK